jgi:hypothetical protein
VARKTSDIALLLGSRGRSRGRSPLGKFVRGIYEAWFGRSQWRETRSSRALQVPGWFAVVLVLAAFGGGWVLGGKAGSTADLRAKTGSGGNAPAAPGPITAGFVGEFDARPLPGHKHCFIVSAYPKMPADEAKAKAKACADYLVGQGLAKARPYEVAAEAGALWVVAVYYDGDQELIATRNHLQSLPQDVPDAWLAQFRATAQQNPDDPKLEWPRAWVIQ